MSVVLTTVRPKSVPGTYEAMREAIEELKKNLLANEQFLGNIELPLLIPILHAAGEQEFLYANFPDDYESWLDKDVGDRGDHSPQGENQPASPE